jgi:hypothetical protein
LIDGASHTLFSNHLGSNLLSLQSKFTLDLLSWPSLKAEIKRDFNNYLIGLNIQQRTQLSEGNVVVDLASGKHVVLDDGTFVDLEAVRSDGSLMFFQHLVELVNFCLADDAIQKPEQNNVSTSTQLQHTSLSKIFCGENGCRLKNELFKG